VIPAYREGSHLADSLATICEVLDSLSLTYELILVDDGSPDNTWEVIQQHAAIHPSTKGIRFSRNFGKEAAIAAGLETAAGEGILVMDADLQHPPDLIPSMVQAWREQNADIVSAVKQEDLKEPWWFRVRRRIFAGVTRRLCGIDLRNASDFKLLSRRVLDVWLSLDERNLFFRGVVSWFGFREIQIPFLVKERAAGQSSWSLSSLLGLAVTGITAFSTAPLRLVGLTGFLFLVLALAFGVYTVFLWATGRAAEGFSTAILLQLMSTSITLLCLGILGEYVGRIYEEVKRRPRYIVSNVAAHQTQEQTWTPPSRDRQLASQSGSPLAVRRAA
jgi:glycosyltransferase involved in cell wall biosynthesis